MRQRGSAVLYTILLSPIIMLSLALVVEAGALQLEKERLRSASDMSAVDAADQAADSAAVGQIDAGSAVTSARQALLDNLTPLQAEIVGVSPYTIANNADVVVTTTVPADDPMHPGTTLKRPTLETRIEVPVHSGLLAAAGLPQTMNFTIESSADLRIVGGKSK